MSIKDSTGAAKTFSLISQSGFDRTFAGADTAFPTILVEKMTRSATKGKQNSSVVTCICTRTDATTGEIYVYKTNISKSYPNSLGAADAAMRDSLLFASRLAIGGADDLSGTPVATEANLDAETRGIMPTP